MAVVRLSEATRTAMLNAIRDAIDAGGGPGTVSFVGMQTLAVLTCAQPCAPDAKKAVLTFAPFVQDDAADADGVVTLARFADSRGRVVFECDVSGLDGDGTIKIDDPNIKAGGPVRLNDFSLSF